MKKLSVQSVISQYQKDECTMEGFPATRAVHSSDETHSEKNFLLARQRVNVLLLTFTGSSVLGADTINVLGMFFLCFQCLYN